MEVHDTGDAAMPNDFHQAPGGNRASTPRTETSRDTQCLQTLLPDGILVHEALDARVAQTPEALGDELQAGRQVVHLGRVSAGQLDGVRRFLQDIQDSLEDSPGRRLSKKRIKLLQNKK